jgi:hypothetical protein
MLAKHAITKCRIFPLTFSMSASISQNDRTANQGRQAQNKTQHGSFRSDLNSPAHPQAQVGARNRAPESLSNRMIYSVLIRVNPYLGISLRSLCLCGFFPHTSAMTSHLVR